MILYNVHNTDFPKCKMLKGQDFDFQYGYYLKKIGPDSGIFSIFLSRSLPVNVSHLGAIGIFIRKILTIHFPDQKNIIRIYIPNYSTPLTRAVKAPFRIDCYNDLFLTLRDDYRIEIL